MITVPTSTLSVRPAVAPLSFREWRSRLDSQGVPAVIGVAGSRGKTTIVRLLNAIFQEAGLRTALWTDQGVEVNGRRQRGELVPWSRAIQRLGREELDVAIQELDWSLVHAVGLPAQTYPVVAISNLCVNNDSCMIRTESLMAGRALQKLRATARHDGALVLNGEDFSVGDHAEQGDSAAVLVGLSRDTPLVRNHVRAGGTAVWTNQDEIMTGTNASATKIGSIADLAFALGGSIAFQVHNALMATAIARSCGIPGETIRAALARFEVPATAMPGSFNVLAIGEAVAVVDRPAPSWFLRTPLRGIFHLLPGHRLITVAGQMASVPDEDLTETGRLLGRVGGALILHSSGDRPDRVALLRQGVVANEVPPVVVHVGTERQAIARALQMLRPDDLAFILADQPTSVLRALHRAQLRARPAG
ncbi:MAG: Mur ligase family protein [Chloroflexota bacterium]|nr:Mur ligase family protein [Chloroflexota bacterium]